MINDSNFKEVLSDGYCIVEVIGDSCANCLTLMPVLYNYSQKKGNIKLYNVEASLESKELCSYYGVESVPTVLLTYNGELIGKVKGYQPEEILEIWLDAKIEECEKNIS